MDDSTQRREGEDKETPETGGKEINDPRTRSEVEAPRKEFQGRTPE